ncbi:acyltransferase [Vibrio sp. TBV020]|uniref:acyltransferase n=1 Tax=Vibrio sp. TBV020 TaxID=3137398 RepID=UPI0038CD30C0
MESTSNKRLDLSTRLRNKVRIEHNNTVTISSGAKLRDCNISIKGQNNRLVIESGVNIRKTQIEIDGNHCTVYIGKDCVIGHGCYLSSREIKTELMLGANCMLSRNVKVMTSDGHDILKGGKRINPAQSISIGEQVWLADNTTVLKGVKIGDNSIVGINSTLTKSIASGSIAVGNPAKVVQTDISWRSDLTY